jgi:STE24 endopeptidase
MLSGLAISILFLLAFQLTGASGLLKDRVIILYSNFYGSLAAYMAVFGLAFYLIMLPLDFYGGFLLERKFSLSNQGVSGWMKDEVKKGVLSSVFFFVSVGALYAIVNNCGEWWWIGASVFWILLTLVIARIFPTVVVPMFYRYNRLQQNELRDRALELTERFGIKVIDVFEIDLSSKTKKANAAVIGWGGSRRIVMADNLVNEFTTDEALVVLAHELAHHKKNHIWKLLSVSAIATTFFFFLASRLPVDIRDISVFPILYLFFLIYNLIAMPIENAISRALEREADMMALEVTKMREQFISMMEKLAEKNLADKDPNRAIELLFYSHPPISKRIALARTIKL